VVAARDPERVDEVVELADEEIDCPEVAVAPLVVCAAAVTDLVLEDDRAFTGEIGERQEVIVRCSRTAVQSDEWGRSVGVVGA